MVGHARLGTVAAIFPFSLFLPTHASSPDHSFSPDDVLAMVCIPIATTYCEVRWAKVVEAWCTLCTGREISCNDNAVYHIIESRRISHPLKGGYSSLLPYHCIALRAAGLHGRGALYSSADRVRALFAFHKLTHSSESNLVSVLTVFKVLVK